MKISRNYSCNTSFLDLLFNMLLAFTALFVLAFAMINQNRQTKNVEAKAEYIITVSWPSDFDDDIDTYVEDPEGHLVMFRRREDGLMHLDRDDLGKRNDTVQTPFGPVSYPENREIVSLRGIVQGEYVVNVHAYLKNDPNPVPVTVQIDRINPYGTVALKTVTLFKSGDEKTVVRFTLNKKGDIIGASELEKCLTRPGGSNQLPSAPSGPGDFGNPDQFNGDEYGP